MTAIVGEWGWLVGERIEQKGERTHGHGQQCGNCRVEGVIRWLNYNGKKNTHFKSCEKKYFIMHLSWSPPLFSTSRKCELSLQSFCSQSVLYSTGHAVTFTDQ